MKRLEDPQNVASELIEENFSALAEVKRFTERWRADSGFRKKFQLEPNRTLVSYGFGLEAGDVCPIVEFEQGGIQKKTYLWDAILQLSDALTELPTATEEQDRKLSDAFTDTRYKTWRERQINRLRSQQILRGYDDIGHLPAAFELTDGCSVGCWFCSLAPEKLEKVYAYTDENVAAWRGVLTTLRSRLGQGVGESFCYWATDPFDNPDYERFIDDFYDIFGHLPRTTTAQAGIYPEKARRLLVKTRKFGGGIRFSVLSVKTLDRIHSAFTPTELANVNLVLQMKGALGNVKSRAGAARQHGDRVKENLTEDYAPSTVTGFIVRMPGKIVQLISPCRPCDRWPSGHRVHAQGRFSTTEEFASLIEQMIAENMPERLDIENRLSFRPDLQFKESHIGFELSTHVKTFTFHHPSYPAKELGLLLKDGCRSAREIIACMSAHEARPSETLSHLNRIFHEGFLDDGL